jgi:hypothetical protein
MFMDFGNSGSQVGTDEEFPAFDFGLDDDEAEVGFWVHVASHLFDELDLLLDAIRCAFNETVFGPTGAESYISS